MDAGSITGRLVKKFDSAGEGEVWVGSPQSRFSKLREILGNDDGGSARRAGGGHVLGIGNKGEFAGLGVCNALQTFDFDFPVAPQPDFELRSNLGKLHALKG